MEPAKVKDADNSEGPGNSEGPDKSEEQDKPQIQRLKETTRVSASQLSTNCHAKISFDKVSGAKGYEIQRSTKLSQGYRKVGYTTKTSYTDKTVKTGITYYYKVIAKADSASYDSALSQKYASLTVLAKPQAKIKALKSRKVGVSWKKVKGASGYVIYTSKNKTKGFKRVKTIRKASAGNITIKSGVKKGRCYVRVRPYKTVNRKPVYGTYSKTYAVKVKR